MTTPNLSNPPDGSFVLGSAYGQDITEASAKAIMSGGTLGSFTNVQNAVNSEIKDPIITNATRLNSQSQTLTNHENRILYLEDGSIAYTFFSDDTWYKPAGYNFHTVHTIGGGAGGQGGEDAEESRGGQGGGRGGWETEIYADEDLPGSSYAISIGAGGLGALSYYMDSFDRANASNLGPDWQTSAVNCQLISGAAQSVDMGVGTGTNGRWNAYDEQLLTDSYEVKALMASPSGGRAQNEFSGVFVASADTWSATTRMVVFVGSTHTGCRMFTQNGTPSAPYFNYGGGIGQSIVASSSVNMPYGSTLRLKRIHDTTAGYSTFYGYVDDTLVCTWADTGNTVPSGEGHRGFGITVAGNHPLFQSAYYSPAISQVVAINIDALPGGDTIFSGGSVTQVGGGGNPGSVYGSSTPADMGDGDVTEPEAGGGSGGDYELSGATAGGDGSFTVGGKAGTLAGRAGSDGGNAPVDKIGVGGGGGGGQGHTAGDGGKGGNGGFPGGPGGGGGGCPLAYNPGGGGTGASGAVFIISSISYPSED